MSICISLVKLVTSVQRYCTHFTIIIVQQLGVLKHGGLRFNIEKSPISLTHNEKQTITNKIVPNHIKFLNKNHLERRTWIRPIFNKKRLLISTCMHTFTKIRDHLSFSFSLHRFSAQLKVETHVRYIHIFLIIISYFSELKFNIYINFNSI